jgi:hypothetical protein
MKNHTEILHLYIDGMLSPNEAAEVAARLETDKALQAEYQNIKTMLHTLNDLGEEDLPEGLGERMLRKPKATRRRRITRVVSSFGAVAAAALAVLVLFTFEGRRDSSPETNWAQVHDIMPMAEAIPGGGFFRDALEDEEADALHFDLDEEIPHFDFGMTGLRDREYAAIIAPAWGAAPRLEQILAQLEDLPAEIESIIYDEDGIRIILFIEN